MKEYKRFKRDMCESEVIHEVGIDIWIDMKKIMRGQTGKIKNGKLYMYDYDLNKAYNIVTQSD